MKRREPKALRKDEVIRLRVTSEQQRAFLHAVTFAGMGNVDVAALLSVTRSEQDAAQTRFKG